MSGWQRRGYSEAPIDLFTDPDLSCLVTRSDGSPGSVARYHPDVGAGIRHLS